MTHILAPRGGGVILWKWLDSGHTSPCSALHVFLKQLIFLAINTDRALLLWLNCFIFWNVALSRLLRKRSLRFATTWSAFQLDNHPSNASAWFPELPASVYWSTLVRRSCLSIRNQELIGGGQLTVSCNRRSDQSSAAHFDQVSSFGPRKQVSW